MTSSLPALNAWIESVQHRTGAGEVHWCDGSTGEYQALIDNMLERGELLALNPGTHPRCYLYRSAPEDTARSEHAVHVCTEAREDAGPNNHWMDPAEAHALMDELFEHCMRGRILYVVPYSLGPADSPLSRCGVVLTDDRYIVANMHMLTHVGPAALRRIERESVFARALHVPGAAHPRRRRIMHFPEETLIETFGTGPLSDAILGKAGHALRLASWQARDEGWLAEHMCMIGIQDPAGCTHYVAAALAAGSDALRALPTWPPLVDQGWKIRVLGGEICWMHPGADGRLWAICPSTGDTGLAAPPRAGTRPPMPAVPACDAIFTNVALTADHRPWWPGRRGKPAIDWQGRPYDPDNGPACHPDARFATAARQYQAPAPSTDTALGVPISAIIFGSQRARPAPPVVEARDWTHGVLMGASMAVHAEATHEQAIRHNPMGMKRFCDYHLGDYFEHWLSLGEALAQPPRIFHVNSRLADDVHHSAWPGAIGRVLTWMFARIEHRVDARETAIGRLPHPRDLAPTQPRCDVDSPLDIDAPAWRDELDAMARYLAGFGERVPEALLETLGQARHALDTRS